jgi:hypothetical protein
VGESWYLRMAQSHTVSDMRGVAAGIGRAYSWIAFDVTASIAWRHSWSIFGGAACSAGAGVRLRRARAELLPQARDSCRVGRAGVDAGWELAVYHLVSPHPSRPSYVLSRPPMPGDEGNGGARGSAGGEWTNLGAWARVARGVRAEAPRPAAATEKRSWRPLVIDSYRSASLSPSTRARCSAGGRRCAACRQCVFGARGAFAVHRVGAQRGVARGAEMVLPCEGRERGAY